MILCRWPLPRIALRCTTFQVVFTYLLTYLLTYLQRIFQLPLECSFPLDEGNSTDNDRTRIMQLFLELRPRSIYMRPQSSRSTPADGVSDCVTLRYVISRTKTVRLVSTRHTYSSETIVKRISSANTSVTGIRRRQKK